MKKSIISIVLVIFLVFTLIPTVVAENISDFAGGDGTKSNPYKVAVAEQLDNVRNCPGKYFVQVDNISLSDMTFIPIGSSDNSFSGGYDGANYIISGAVITENQEGYAGLFGYSTGAISNVSLRDSEITASSSSRVVYAGGIVAYSIGTITNCKSGATIYSKTIGEKLNAYAGGIVGYTNREVLKCVFFGEATAKVEYIDSNAYAGGIAAYGGTYTDCHNTGIISAVGSAGSNAYAGGITTVSGSVSNCSNSGSVSASKSKYSYAGGIIGENSGTITGCSNSGIVYASTKYSYAETYTGGIVGKNRGNVLYCYNTGYVSGDSSSSHVRAGGIVGYNYSTIEDCYNKGSIYSNSSAYESHAGGIAGTTSDNSYIRRCYNNGSVTSGENGLYSLGSAGGIVGLLQYGNIVQCYNSGSITAISSNYSTFAAGIAGGTDEGLIIDCFNAGDIHTTLNVNVSYISGGAAGIFVGHNTVSSKCYNVGTISSNGLNVAIGGIHHNNGPESNSVEACYYLDTCLDTSGISMTAEQTMLGQTYDGFNFNDIWSISSTGSYKYPRLKTLAAADSLASAKAASAALTPTDYTKSSWTVLSVALALPETNKSEVITKTTAINNAIVTLISVISIDINGDKIIDIHDLVIISRAYGRTPENENWDARTDLNKDEIVSLIDLEILSSAYGVDLSSYVKEK